ncbi:hypothetical protein [Cyclobacterium sp.]|uniref:hypothetical protein n=1 Tax=Cyclobacterium TaxID=68288 RepID=UPI0019AE4847|nr:hypothetical protein [Cyclobacterium sp.]MBD3629955.1 hypothetical protein [Cyclobacterium sp.]
MEKLPTPIPRMLIYLHDASGKEKVKERLQVIYDWMQSKLTRSNGDDALNKLWENPKDLAFQENLNQAIEEAHAEDDLFHEELNVRLAEVEDLINKEDPDWDPPLAKVTHKPK